MPLVVPGVGAPTVVWHRRRFGNVRMRPFVPDNAAISPPQLDAPPLEINAVVGILLIDLTSPAADDANQQHQEVESSDPWGRFTRTGLRME